MCFVPVDKTQFYAAQNAYFTGFSCILFGHIFHWLPIPDWHVHQKFHGAYTLWRQRNALLHFGDFNFFAQWQFKTQVPEHQRFSRVNGEFVNCPGHHFGRVQPGIHPLPQF